MIVILQFQRGSEFGNSTQREDFLKYSSESYYPDASARWRGILHSDVSERVLGGIQISPPISIILKNIS